MLTIASFLQQAYDWYIPPVLFLCMTVGSLLLWRRTRRRSALAQFVAALALFVMVVLTGARSFATIPPERSAMSRFLWSTSMDAAIPWVAALSCLTFVGAYVAYAATTKRI